VEKLVRRNQKSPQKGIIMKIFKMLIVLSAVVFLLNGCLLNKITKRSAPTLPPSPEPPLKGAHYHGIYYKEIKEI
jgi:hypothetical protein